jgi:NAD(P)-dependent dehydrogenase (short-subunit alcohol dehydrogenase family)
MNRIDLEGRVAIVTGGARGIGRAIADRLAASGARVAIWDIDRSVAENTAASIFNAVAFTTDITDPAAIERALHATISGIGAPDILINNAGITGPNHPLDQYPIDAWRQVIEIDLLGVFYCCRAVVPLMRQKNRGHIVNIASIAGKEGNPNASAYSAAKAGVIWLTKSLGKELADTGIRVNAVAPAAAKTDIFNQMTEAQIDYICRRSRWAGLSRSRKSPRSSRGFARTIARLPRARCSTSPAAARLIESGIMRRRSTERLNAASGDRSPRHSLRPRLDRLRELGATHGRHIAPVCCLGWGTPRVIVCLIDATLPLPHSHLPLVKSDPWAVPLAFVPWHPAHVPPSACPSKMR